jgi:hypothetical protein
LKCIQPPGKLRRLRDVELLDGAFGVHAMVRKDEGAASFDDCAHTLRTTGDELGTVEAVTAMRDYIPSVALQRRRHRSDRF